MKDVRQIAKLAPRACAGDREAVGQIVEATRSRLLAVAYAQLDDREDALDAVASALVHICQKAHQVRDPSRIEPWMQAIVRREARQLQRSRPALLPLGDYQHPSYRVETTSQLRLDLERALRVLPAHQEQAMRLHYGQQLSAREITDRFGVAEGTVKMWLHRARRFLARELEGYEPMPVTPIATTATLKPSFADFPVPDFSNPDWSVEGVPEDARYAGILHDNLSNKLLDALKAGLTAGGYVPVPVTWQEVGGRNSSHGYNWSRRLSLLVLDETVGGMLGLVSYLLLFKNRHAPIPVPTCLFYSNKLNFDEQDAFIVAGVEHFLRKNKPYDIANFARPFRRRGPGWSHASVLGNIMTGAMETAIQQGRRTVDALDFMFAFFDLFDRKPKSGDKQSETNFALRVLHEFGLNAALVRDALSPHLTPGTSDAPAFQLPSSGDVLSGPDDFNWLPEYDEMVPADDYKRLWDDAHEESELLLDDYMDAEHFLLAALRMQNAPVGRVLHERGMSLEAARAILRRLRDLPPPLPVP